MEPRVGRGYRDCPGAMKHARRVPRQREPAQRRRPLCLRAARLALRLARLRPVPPAPAP
jgi:hypothetical protein